MNAKIIPFRQTRLLLVERDGQPFVPMKPVVEGMGLDWKSQHAKLTSGRMKTCMVEITMQMPGDDQGRAMTCLPLRKLAGWLMTIHPNKVRPDLREGVIAYQAECDDVLWDYWNEGIAARSDSRSFDSVMNATIGTDGFHMLGAIIDGKTRRLPTARRRAATTHMWEQVHRAFGVARGADIPASQLDAARNFVAAYALEGEWLPAETSLQPGSTCTKSQTRPVSDYPLSLWDQLDPIRKHLPKHFSLGAVMISQRLMFGMDRQITPLDNLLRELEALGVDVGALKLELKSMRYHLEMFDSAAREIGEVVARRRAA